MIKKYSKNIIMRIIDEDFPGMAAEMAFMFVLGIFPFLLVLMSFFGWMGKKAFIYANEELGWEKSADLFVDFCKMHLK